MLGTTKLDSNLTFSMCFDLNWRSSDPRENLGEWSDPRTMMTKEFTELVMLMRKFPRLPQVQDFRLHSICEMIIPNLAAVLIHDTKSTAGIGRAYFITLSRFESKILFSRALFCFFYVFLSRACQ